MRAFITLVIACAACLSVSCTQEPVTDTLLEIRPDSWSVSLPGPGTGMSMAEDGVFLSNRGYLFSREKWAQRREKKSGEDVTVWLTSMMEVQFYFPKTTDRLQVLLHCNGRVQGRGTYPVHDALRIDVSVKTVTVEYVANKNVTELKRSAHELQEEKWHTIRVTDDSKNRMLRVAINGKEIIATAYDNKKWFVGELFGFTGDPRGSVKLRSLKRKLE